MRVEYVLPWSRGPEVHHNLFVALDVSSDSGRALIEALTYRCMAVLGSVRWWRKITSGPYPRCVSDLTTRAANAAELHLATALPRRWRHVQAVAAKARRVGPVMADVDPDVLTAAAWLHDIGYAPDIAETGLHALDGARWLVREGFDRRLAGLVAHHSCASYEARERGLADVLITEFPQEHSPTADALWFVDMTTGPDGQDMTVESRLMEIRRRYSPDDVVTRFWQRAEPSLLDAVRRTESRLGDQPM